MMLYAMNTRTKVFTDDPSDNEFGHTLDGGCTFVYLASTNGGATKVWVTYGGFHYGVGERVQMTNDTGLGHRSMPDHIVVAILSQAGLVGEIPTGKRKIALWVAK